MAKVNTKKDEQFAKIIHDLRTPIVAQITALKTFLGTTKDKISQDEQDLIKLTLNSCEYMQKLIDVFNMVEKLNYEKIKLNYETFNFTELVQNSIKDLDILLKYHELKIIFKPRNSYTIRADKLQIKRVVENLLSNSINYTFKNTIIEVKIFAQNNLLTMEIKNKSPYMEESTLKEIFGKYKTKTPLYSNGGVGLGLYLSSEIIHAHFGKMIARSSLDNYNVFGFQLPIS